MKRIFPYPIRTIDDMKFHYYETTHPISSISKCESYKRHRSTNELSWQSKFGSKVKFRQFLPIFVSIFFKFYNSISALKMTCRDIFHSIKPAMSKTLECFLDSPIAIVNKEKMFHSTESLAEKQKINSSSLKLLLCATTYAIYWNVKRNVLFSSSWNGKSFIFCWKLFTSEKLLLIDGIWIYLNTIWLLFIQTNMQMKKCEF